MCTGLSCDGVEAALLNQQLGHVSAQLVVLVRAMGALPDEHPLHLHVRLHDIVFGAWLMPNIPIASATSCHDANLDGLVLLLAAGRRDVVWRPEHTTGCPDQVIPERRTGMLRSLMYPP